ncbi:MAG: hypothetical protein MMC23_000804 [Stictis urceolatum]|nr:hypothetical protein [Stictis urceolata]
MPQTLSLAVAQPSTQPTLSQTLAALSDIAHRAAEKGADLLLLPEAYLGGYPRGCAFGASVGSRSDTGREQFLQYWNEAVDLGDTPRGDPEWANYDGNNPKTSAAENPARSKPTKGDGTRERLEKISSSTNLFLITGVVERAGGSLYCAAVYICPRLGCIGKRRKVMPTGTERLIWAQGDPGTLRAVTTEIKGVKLTLAAAVCWENYMPLLRFALYSQNVNLWLAPTADARGAWEGLVRTVAVEGRCFVLSACMCVREGEGAGWIRGTDGGGKAGGEERERGESGEVNGVAGARGGKRRTSVVTRTEDNHEITWPTSPAAETRRRSSVAIAEGPHEIILPVVESAGSATSRVDNDGKESEALVEEDKGPSGPPPEGYTCRGGSCIIGPNGDVLAGPLWEEPDGILVVEVDFDDCIRGRLDFDAAGSYSRNDAFELKVRGLDLNPPA